MKNTESLLAHSQCIGDLPEVADIFEGPYRDLAAYRAMAGDLAGAVDALSKFTYLRPPMTLALVSESLKFMKGSLRDDYIEGLRRAGLT